MRILPIKIYLFLCFTFLVPVINVYSQNKYFKRILDEASSINPLQNSSGTGFLISQNGYIITNRHVVEGAINLKVTFEKNGKKITKEAKILEIDNEVDLALLQIVDDKTLELNSILNQPITYSLSENSMELGDKVYVLGYPTPNIMGTNIKMTEGSVSATSGFMDDKEMYQISAPIQPGNSGSPMFDFYGNIRGIIVASYTNGQIVNYSIKSRYLKQFLNNYLSSKKKSTTKIAEFFKPKYSSDFKKNISSITQKICLIEVLSKKTKYEEVSLQKNSFSFKNSSTFSKYSNACTDEELEYFFANNLYRNQVDRDNIPIFENWVANNFNTDYSKAIFFTLLTNYNFSEDDLLDYYYKLESLMNIGAYQNVIEEHDFKFRLTTTKINSFVFDTYTAAHFPSYFLASMEVYKHQYKEIRNLIKYIDLLLSINESINSNANKSQYYLFNISKLLQAKAFAMINIPTDYSQKEICKIINLAKTIDFETKVWPMECN